MAFNNGSFKGSSLHCSFCGKSQEQVEKLIAGEGVYICNECVQVCADIMIEEGINIEGEAVGVPEASGRTEGLNSLDNLPTPMQMHELLDQHVIGQDAAKRAL